MLGFDALAKIPLAALPQLGIVDITGTAAGTATVSGAIEAVKDFAGSAAGAAIVSGAIEAVKDFAGTAAGAASVTGIIEALTGVDHSGAGLAAGLATAAAIGEGATKLSRDITAPGFDLAGSDVAIDPLTGFPVVLTDTGPGLERDDEAIEATALPQAQAVTAAKTPISRSTQLFQ